MHHVGVVLDLDVLVAEITMLEKVLPNLRKKLIISPRCHVIFPYHKLLDRLYEEAKGKSKTGTTGRASDLCMLTRFLIKEFA